MLIRLTDMTMPSDCCIALLEEGLECSRFFQSEYIQGVTSRFDEVVEQIGLFISGGVASCFRSVNLRLGCLSLRPDRLVVVSE